MIERLQIYKDTYRLTDMMYKAMPQMAKTHRHVIGARLLDTALDLFKWISLANQTRDKQERLKYLDCYLCSFEQLRTYLLICNDNALFKISTIVSMQQITTALGKQLQGWRSATSRA